MKLIKWHLIYGKISFIYENLQLIQNLKISKKPNNVEDSPFIEFEFEISNVFITCITWM